MQPKEYFRKSPQAHRRGVSIDIPLLLAVLFLIGIGCFFIYDFTVVSSTVPAKNYYLMRQLMFAALGCCYLMIVSKIDYHFLYQLVIPLLLGTTALSFCARVSGSTGFIYWQTPYLFIGGIGIHVESILEITAPLFLAQLMSHIDLGGRNRLFLVLSALSVCLLPMLSLDYASTMILLMTLCSLFFLVDTRLFLPVFTFTVAVMIACWFFVHGLPQSKKAGFKGRCACRWV